MPFIKEKFSNDKVEKLYHYLLNGQEQAEPEDYEIFVDNFKVVKRTKDLTRFHAFEEYLQPDTKSVSILIYDGMSPRNTKHILMLSDEPDSSLNGLDNRIDERLRVEKERWDYAKLQTDFDNLKKELEESEKYIDALEKTLEKTKENKFRLGDINLAELASVMAEGFIRRNPQLLTKIGADNLAGIIIQDNEERKNLPVSNEPETEVTFTKKSTANPAAAPALSEEDKSYLEFIHSIKGRLNKEQAESLFIIIDELVKQPQHLEPVTELLNSLNAQ